MANQPEFRGPDLERDAEALVRIMNRRSEEFAEPFRTTVAELRHFWETTPNFDPAADAVGVWIGDQLAAFASVEWLDEHEGPRMYRHEVQVDPAWFGHGLGTQLLRWAHRRIEELDAKHGVRPAEIRTEGNDFDLALPTILGTAHYRQAASYAILIRPNLDDIPEAPLPTGIEIRPVSEAHYRLIYEADIEAFRDHRGFGDTGEAGYQRFREDPHFAPSLWKVAWEGDEIVGQVRTFIDEEANQAIDVSRGWTEDISVRRPWRGRGIARALICASLRELRVRGYEEAALAVHAENPTGALHLYTGLGYEVVSTYTEWVREL